MADRFNPQEDPNKARIFPVVLNVPAFPKGAAKPVIQATSEQRQMVDKLPLIRVKKMSGLYQINISGPNGKELLDLKPQDQNRLGTVAYGMSISLYPRYANTSSRDGDPICDSYRLQFHDGGALFCLADGCAWGERPREASNRAKDAFIGYLQTKVDKFTSVRDIGQHLITALSHAHWATYHDKEDVFMAGTTTFLGGVMIKQDHGHMYDDKPSENPWSLVFISVGDCKIFQYVADDKKVFDLTADNRAEVLNATDPGGRIGPQVGNVGDPDLRNLDLVHQTCKENDILLVVSDGVHDNLDPGTLGLAPRAIGLPGDAYDSWRDVEKVQRNLAKEKFMTELVNKLLLECPKPSPTLFTKRLIGYSRDVTEKSRVFMEQTGEPSSGLSYEQYPGKMDHCTCLSFRCGSVSYAFDPNMQEADLTGSLNPIVFPF